MISGKLKTTLKTIHFEGPSPSKFSSKKTSALADTNKARTATMPRAAIASFPIAVFVLVKMTGRGKYRDPEF